MDSTQVGTWLGLANGLFLLLLSSISHKRIPDLTDIGFVGAVFLASYNIWPPIFLFRFAMEPATRNTLPVALNGYEKYIVFAAFISFLLTVLGIISLYVKACARKRS